MQDLRTCTAKELFALSGVCDLLPANICALRH
jgi:hypothetical protein